MKEMIKRFGIVFLLTFVNGLSLTMLFPVLPFIVRSYAQPEYALGVLLGTFSFFQFIAAPILWSLSDKYGRKTILAITQAGTLLAWIVLGISYLLPSTEVFWFLLLPILVIFFARMLDGITGWNNSVSNAIFADLTDRKERSKVLWFNAAFFGMSLLVWPALGGLSLSLPLWHLATSILGWTISLLTLLLIVFVFTESLPPEKRDKELQISFKKLNIISQVIKWWGNDKIRYTILMKLFFYTWFVIYTSTSVLYYIDVFGFSANQVWFFLTFTGSFLIFHQMLLIPRILKKFWDVYALILGLILMTLWYFSMWLAGENIILFTVAYFFWVLGIASCFTTTAALISKSVDEKYQGEIAGLSTSIESLVAIGVPILGTYLYAVLPFSIFYFVSILPLLWLFASLFLYKSVKEMSLTDIS